MKIILNFLICTSTLSAAAQDLKNDIKVFYETKTGGYILYATNISYAPISVSLDLSLDHMTFSQKDRKIFVVPAKTERYHIGDLDKAGEGKSKFSFRYIDNYGDITLQRYDTSYVYDLPFPKGRSFLLFQGYNGSFSHQNQNALDFTMPEGTEIFAAREGIVTQVVQNNTESCPQKDCAKYNNRIRILQPDGTFATYAHIKYNGAKVKPGDIVKKGDLIALSGNTGWSSGPHVHFAVSLPGFGEQKTVTTKFRVANAAGEYLAEGGKYQRVY